MILIQKTNDATCHHCRKGFDELWRIQSDGGDALFLCEQGMRELEWSMGSADFKHEYIARTEWNEEDVQSIRKSWDLERCRRELERNTKYLKERTCEEGWEILNTLLPMEHEKE